MSGFESHEIPGWVLEQFNAQTALPHGPMELLPVPLEGQIVGAQATVPTNGNPPRWTATIHCGEPVADTMRFYEEFLPLANYSLIGVGEYVQRSSWFSRTPALENGLIVFRVGEYLGRLETKAAYQRTTEVHVEIAHMKHDSVYDLVDRELLRRRPDVRWSVYP